MNPTLPPILPPSHRYDESGSNLFPPHPRQVKMNYAALLSHKHETVGRGKCEAAGSITQGSGWKGREEERDGGKVMGITDGEAYRWREFFRREGRRDDGEVRNKKMER